MHRDSSVVPEPHNGPTSILSNVVVFQFLPIFSGANPSEQNSRIGRPFMRIATTVTRDAAE